MAEADPKFLNVFDNADDKENLDIEEQKQQRSCLDRIKEKWRAVLGFCCPGIEQPTDEYLERQKQEEEVKKNKNLELGVIWALPNKKKKREDLNEEEILLEIEKRYHEIIDSAREGDESDSTHMWVSDGEIDPEFYDDRSNSEDSNGDLREILRNDGEEILRENRKKKFKEVLELRQALRDRSLSPDADKVKKVQEKRILFEKSIWGKYGTRWEKGRVCIMLHPRIVTNHPNVYGKKLGVIRAGEMVSVIRMKNIVVSTTEDDDHDGIWICRAEVEYTNTSGIGDYKLNADSDIDFEHDQVEDEEEDEELEKKKRKKKRKGKTINGWVDLADLAYGHLYIARFDDLSRAERKRLKEIYLPRFNPYSVEVRKKWLKSKIQNDYRRSLKAGRDYVSVKGTKGWRLGKVDRIRNKDVIVHVATKHDYDPVEHKIRSKSLRLHKDALDAHEVENTIISAFVDLQTKHHTENDLEVSVKELMEEIMKNQDIAILLHSKRPRYIFRKELLDRPYQAMFEWDQEWSIFGRKLHVSQDAMIQFINSLPRLEDGEEQDTATITRKELEDLIGIYITRKPEALAEARDVDKKEMIKWKKKKRMEAANQEKESENINLEEPLLQISGSRIRVVKSKTSLYDDMRFLAIDAMQRKRQKETVSQEAEKDLKREIEITISATLQWPNGRFKPMRGKLSAKYGYERAEKSAERAIRHRDNVMAKKKAENPNIQKIFNTPNPANPNYSLARRRMISPKPFHGLAFDLTHLSNTAVNEALSSLQVVMENHSLQLFQIEDLPWPLTGNTGNAWDETTIEKKTTGKNGNKGPRDRFPLLSLELTFNHAGQESKKMKGGLGVASGTFHLKNLVDKPAGISNPFPIVLENDLGPVAHVELNITYNSLQRTGIAESLGIGGSWLEQTLRKEDAVEINNWQRSELMSILPWNDYYLIIQQDCPANCYLGKKSMKMITIVTLHPLWTRKHDDPTGHHVIATNLQLIVILGDQKIEEDTSKFTSLELARQKKLKRDLEKKNKITKAYKKMSVWRGDCKKYKIGVIPQICVKRVTKDLPRSCAANHGYLDSKAEERKRRGLEREISSEEDSENDEENEHEDFFSIKGELWILYIPGNPGEDFRYRTRKLKVTVTEKDSKGRSQRKHAIKDLPFQKKTYRPLMWFRGPSGEQCATFISRFIRQSRVLSSKMNLQVHIADLLVSARALRIAPGTPPPDLYMTIEVPGNATVRTEDRSILTKQKHHPKSAKTLNKADVRLGGFFADCSSTNSDAWRPHVNPQDSKSKQKRGLTGAARLREIREIQRKRERIQLQREKWKKRRQKIIDTQSVYQIAMERIRQQERYIRRLKDKMDGIAFDLNQRHAQIDRRDYLQANVHHQALSTKLLKWGLVKPKKNGTPFTDDDIENSVVILKKRQTEAKKILQTLKNDAHVIRTGYSSEFYLKCLPTKNCVRIEDMKRDVNRSFRLATSKEALRKQQREEKEILNNIRKPVADRKIRVQTFANKLLVNDYTTRLIGFIDRQRRPLRSRRLFAPKKMEYIWEKRKGQPKPEGWGDGAGIQNSKALEAMTIFKDSIYRYSFGIKDLFRLPPGLSSGDHLTLRLFNAENNNSLGVFRIRLRSLAIQNGLGRGGGKGWVEYPQGGGSDRCLWTAQMKTLGIFANFSVNLVERPLEEHVTYKSKSSRNQNEDKGWIHGRRREFAGEWQKLPSNLRAEKIALKAAGTSLFIRQLVNTGFGKKKYDLLDESDLIVEENGADTHSRLEIVDSKFGNSWAKQFNLDSPQPQKIYMYNVYALHARRTDGRHFDFTETGLEEESIEDGVHDEATSRGGAKLTLHIATKFQNGDESLDQVGSEEKGGGLAGEMFGGQERKLYVEITKLSKGLKRGRKHNIEVHYIHEGKREVRNLLFWAQTFEFLTDKPGNLMQIKFLDIDEQRTVIGVADIPLSWANMNSQIVGVKRAVNIIKPGTHEIVGQAFLAIHYAPVNTRLALQSCFESTRKAFSKQLDISEYGNIIPNLPSKARSGYPKFPTEDTADHFLHSLDKQAEFRRALAAREAYLQRKIRQEEEKAGIRR
ncbi:hypothetical protein AAMO2058_001382800 [Amorphochlora amoebiformis]